MGSRTAYSLTFLCVLSLLALHFKGIYGDSSVVFLDSPTRNYFRHKPTQTAALSPSEVGAAASVLLGIAPPSTLTAASSAKLHEVLMPKPFDKPHAVLMLEVAGAEDSQLIVDGDKSAFGGSHRIKVVDIEQRVDIYLPDEDEVSLVSLDELSNDAECSDKELSEFASWLGGSYAEDASKPLNGEVIIPMANDVSLRLQMSKGVDREFFTSLLFLINNIRRAMEMHQMLINGKRSPAELVIGRFNGIKDLQDHYGTEGIAQYGLELFATSISKAFDSLQAAYQGRVVGMIINGGPLASQSEKMIHVTETPRPSARWLEETESSSNITQIAEVLFVRRTLAWITGIILLIATLLGIYFLLNMPVTKDTLLYSNVKLD
ncbi:hypothetical protein CDL12_16136 [Handroanthus impetiginosus]|uniref:DUF7794 domain-containing protein n=1 Tax=Handroanthus impetiginosus TaxID=429701 RepID=A0A2G9H153_9LAMI|nr:hypothetical protein CDL12_16136 [Handroanthus impetiginosus]